MRFQQQRVWITWHDVVGLPGVTWPVAFMAQPTWAWCLAYLFGFALVVSCVVLPLGWVSALIPFAGLGLCAVVAARRGG